MEWLIALALLALVILLGACIPLGVRLIYGENGLSAVVLLGFFRISLYPLSPRLKWLLDKLPSPEKEEPKQEKAQKPVKKKPEQKPDSGGKLTEFLPLIKQVLALLDGVRKKLRVRNLQLYLVMAAEDPADLALYYSSAWAVVGNLMPLLERAFVIKNRDIQVNYDFLSETTKIYFRIDATITAGRISLIAVKYGLPLLISFIKSYKNFKEGGTENESEFT